MPSGHLVDPELKTMLETFPQVDISLDTVLAVRKALAELFSSVPAPEELSVTVEEITVPGSSAAPPVRMLAYRPRDRMTTLPALVHCHGGGYMFGAPEMADVINRFLAVDLDCAIFSVDYRLAPETRHPGPIDDCYAALKWVSGNAANLQIDRARIGIKGESAGGGLAAAVALMVRDRAEFPLAFQHLMYPMIDDRTCLDRDPHPFVGEFQWTRAHNTVAWSALLGIAPGTPGVSSYAAAARTMDLTGLPPTFISVGALDLFLEEDLEYARRLTRSGVSVEFHVYPGAFHSFDMVRTARVAQAAERDSRDALRRALHG
jgi:acetyl esterase/lipase